MNKNELRNKIAQYESAIEQLETELNYIDQLMRVIGFNEGLKAVRASAEELKKNQNDGLSFAE